MTINLGVTWRTRLLAGAEDSLTINFVTQHKVVLIMSKHHFLGGYQFVKEPGYWQSHGIQDGLEVSKPSLSKKMKNEN